MKRGTPDHPKTRKLARGLDISISHAVGLLECMWHFTARYAIQGDIGKHTDEAIAEAMYWTSSAKALIGALISFGWLDIDDTHRLLVHHWYEHADQSVKKTLQNKDLQFFHPTGRNDSNHPTETVSPSLSLSHSLSSARARARAEADWKSACECMSVDVLNADTFKAIWLDWCKHRREIGKSLKATTIKRQIRKLENMGLATAIAALEYSIEQGYMGIWQPKPDEQSSKSSVDAALAGMEDGHED